MTKDQINAIGLWTLRIILAIGAIVLGFTDHEDFAAVCAVVVFWSLFFQ